MAQSVTLEQFAAILETLPADVERKARNGLRKSAARLVVLVEHSIRNNTPFPLVDRGRLVQSVQLIITLNGAIVRVDAPWAPPLEWGARPFMPPLEPILEWAQRKGFENPAAVAQAVRWKFFHHGMAPKRFFGRARDEWLATNTLSAEVLKALEEKT